MILNIEIIPTTYQHVNKNGKKYNRTRQKTVYTVQCDACNKIMVKEKGETHRMRSQEKHACSSQCRGKLSCDIRWNGHVSTPTLLMNGYVKVGNKMEHHIKMSEHLGHPLKYGQIVHHIDGVKNNNDIENLILCEDRKEHKNIHVQLENLALNLVQQGVILFCKSCKMYFTEQNRCGCNP